MTAEEELEDIIGLGYGLLVGIDRDNISINDANDRLSKYTSINAEFNVGGVLIIYIDETDVQYLEMYISYTESGKLIKLKLLNKDCLIISNMSAPIGETSGIGHLAAMAFSSFVIKYLRYIRATGIHGDIAKEITKEECSLKELDVW